MKVDYKQTTFCQKYSNAAAQIQESHSLENLHDFTFLKYSESTILYKSNFKK